MEKEEQIKVLKRWNKNFESELIKLLEDKKLQVVIVPNDFQAKLHWKHLMNTKIDMAIDFIKKEFRKIEIN